MLVVQMPENPRRRRQDKRRRLRAVAYLIPLVIFVAVVFAAPALWIQLAALAAEWWLLWAVSTDPRLRR